MKATSLNRKIAKFENDDRLYFHRYRLSNEQYHQCTNAVSSSALKDLYETKNPAYCHAKYIKRIIPHKETPALIIGQATHKLILEYRSFKKEFAVWEGGRKSGALWNDFKITHDGKTILSKADYDSIRRLRDAVMRNPEANKLLAGCNFEESVFWRDDETGVMCRARADAVKTQSNSKIIVDLKTTLCAEPTKFIRDLIKLNYPIQEAMYMEGFQADAFAFIAVEKGDFNTVQVYDLDDIFDSAGHFLYRETLEKWAEHLHSGKWPAYREGISTLEAPNWWSLKVLGA
jgi:hypothetical protein